MYIVDIKKNYTSSKPDIEHETCFYLSLSFSVRNTLNGAGNDLFFRQCGGNWVHWKLGESVFVISV